VKYSRRVVMFRTFILIGTWVLSECMLLVSIVVCVFYWLKWDVSNFGRLMWMLMLCRYISLVLMATCHSA
jgi:hypothetical protein